MKTYQQFIRKLILNYIIGSFISVIVVGGVLIFTTLEMTSRDMTTLFFVLITSLVIMMICEFFVFKRHLIPIRHVFKRTTSPTKEEIKEAYKQVHRFPQLTGIRILVPHLLGLSIPAIIITSYLIANDRISLPYEFIIYAMIGAMLIAGMHAMIEYFHTTFAIEPVLDELQKMSKHYFNSELCLEENILVSLKTKFQLSALLIGAFPLLLFSLVTQVRTSGHTNILISDYWTWAGLILVMAICLSLYGAWLLFSIVMKPISHLQNKMKRIEKGELTTSKEKDYYSDEFSILVSGFNHMINGLKERDQLKNQLLESFISTLAAALDARDPYTAGHSVRVAKYSIGIATKLGLSEEEKTLIKQTALLHDIGKIGVPDHILLKEDRLTEEEFAVIKKHPVLGVEILKQVHPKEMVLSYMPGIRSHHERMDGKGYPDQLVGDDIPMVGRIIAVCDAFDAMTTDRPYRRGMTKDQALRILKEGRGTQWDAMYVDYFEEWLEEWDFEFEPKVIEDFQPMKMM